MKPKAFKDRYVTAEEAAGGLGGINAYDDESAALKEQFLRDAAAIARAVGKKLAENGWTTNRVSVNRAGIAVSGEVWGLYVPPDPKIGLLVEYGTSSLRSPYLPARHIDGVCIMAQYRIGEPGYRSIIGANQWIESWLDSDMIAENLLTIYQRHP